MFLQQILEIETLIKTKIGALHILKLVYGIPVVALKQQASLSEKMPMISGAVALLTGRGRIDSNYLTLVAADSIFDNG